MMLKDKKRTVAVERTGRAGLPARSLTGLNILMELLSRNKKNKKTIKPTSTNLGEQGRASHRSTGKASWRCLPGFYP